MTKLTLSRPQSWDLDDVSDPVRTVVTSAPIWRARWLPFGDGVLTLPQRSDHGLSIWGTQKSDELEAQGEKAKPVARFEGAREGVKEYVWRTRGGEDLESGALLNFRSFRNLRSLFLIYLPQTTVSSSS